VVGQCRLQCLAAFLCNSGLIPRERSGKEGTGRGKREGKGREGKGREGKGREGKGREGKGREGKFLIFLPLSDPLMDYPLPGKQ
jgi:hypothetical protein